MESNNSSVLEIGDLQCLYGLNNEYIDQLFNNTLLKTLNILKKFKLRQTIRVPIYSINLKMNAFNNKNKRKFE